MQPTNNNNNITNTHQDLNIGNINPSIEVNIPQISNIPLISSNSLHLPINNRQISNSNAIDNCNKEYTASEFLDLLQNNKLPNPPITVVGDIKITNNTEITQLPKNLTVIGTLKITECPNIKSIPSGLIATTLAIYQCINLTEFAIGIEVDTLEIMLCDKLSVFNNAIVKKSLGIVDCNSVTELPIVSNEIQDINLQFLKNFILPNNLTTNGKLVLMNCDKITTLAENMIIGGDLFLDLVNLTMLPNNLKVHGNIRIMNCFNFTSLPTYWLEDMPNNLPVTMTNTHNICLENTLISSEEINYYNENTPSQINFLQETDLDVLRLEKLIKLWQAKALNRDTITITNITEQEYRDLRMFLYKLIETASAINKKTKKYFAEQVVKTLLSIANNTEIKERALLIINNSVSGCEDRVSLGLAELDFLPLLFTAEQQAKTDKQGSELLAVAKQKLLIDEIKQYAIMHATENNASAEEVEFILAYTIKLARYFSLPITVKEMNYEGVANISNTDVDIASIVIDTKVTDEYFSQWLTSWEPWQKHSRRWAIKQYTVLTRKRIFKDDIPSNSLCIISLDALENITNPVYYNNQLYSYDALCKWYIEKGTNPVNPSETINLDEIYSLRIDETDNGDITAKRRKII